MIDKILHEIVIKSGRAAELAYELSKLTCNGKKYRYEYLLNRLNPENNAPGIKLSELPAFCICARQCGIDLSPLKKAIVFEFCESDVVINGSILDEMRDLALMISTVAELAEKSGGEVAELGGKDRVILTELAAKLDTIANRVAGEAGRKSWRK